MLKDKKTCYVIHIYYNILILFVVIEYLNILLKKKKKKNEFDLFACTFNSK